MPPDGELRHPIAELWSRPWAGMRPTIKPVPPEVHLRERPPRNGGAARAARGANGRTLGAPRGLRTGFQASRGPAPGSLRAASQAGPTREERASPMPFSLSLMPRPVPRFQPPGGVAGPGSSVKNGHRLHAGGLHAQAQPPRTQTRVALRRPLLRPDGRLAAAGARPCRCRVRTSHASQTLHFLRPRSSRLRLSPPKPHFTAAAALRPGAAQK